VVRFRDMNDPSLESLPAVILCGGRGTRLDEAGDALPKALVEVHGRPILHHAIKALVMHGFQKVILPLGHRGEQIREHVEQTWDDNEIEVIVRDTGDDTPVAGRVQAIYDLLPSEGSFFLVNGDTLFDFDVRKMLEHHHAAGAWVTLATSGFHSPYGLVLEENGRLTRFARNLPVQSMKPAENPDAEGYVYTGLAWIRTHALARLEPDSETDFEEALFPAMIQEGRVARYPINGSWLAIDTVKDLAAANQDPRFR
jgi:glucose-1-phosphate cytidylyltransferase